MTNRERFCAVLNGERPDRLPIVEWAGWWDKTTANWLQEGMPAGLDYHQILAYYGMDDLFQLWINHRRPEFPAPASHGAGLIKSRSDYLELKKKMYAKEYLSQCLDLLRAVKPRHEAGEVTMWFTVEGFFWFPRTLFGIEPHLYAFYDEPELMHEINRDQTAYTLWFLEEMYKVVTPDFMTFAEDMSYNHGPMLSKACYDEFVKPYYQQIIPLIKSHKTHVLIDTDGDVEPLIPWFAEAGIEGVLPLERQAGVDVNRIRQHYPAWLMVGGYDKTVMHKGEEAMRNEFERILPAMRSGRYIPAVDHQTPPDVSLENYRIYVSLLREYAAKAVE